MSDLRVGLIVRCDDRGLANQTLEVYRNIPYSKVLVVRDPGSERQGFVPHPERFPDGTVVFFERYRRGGPVLDEGLCRSWLNDLDVVYSAETFYDWRFCDWAKDAGVATVLHANPEFYFHWREPNTPRPSTWWSATNWRVGNMPKGTRIVQMPVPIDRWDADKIDFDHNPRRVLHIGGLEAIRDRNGTRLVTQVAEAVSSVDFLVNLQDNRKNKYLHQRNVEHYWEMYDNDTPVVLLPRRYGGLCLPAIEAIGSGKLVVMPDIEPNRMWPIYPVPANPEKQVLTTQGGDIQLYAADVGGMIASMKHLFDSGELSKLRRQSYDWAKANSWSNMVDIWMNELRIAAESL